MQANIYILKDSFSGEVRYVGKAMNVKQRLGVHLNEAKVGKSKRHVLYWIKTLTDKGGLPVLEIIEKCPCDKWEEREIFWISYYRSIGAKLCNHSDGGSGTRGTDCRVYESEEQRKMIYKRIEGNLPFKYSLEQRRKIKPIILSANSHRECQSYIPEVKRNTYYEVRSGKIWQEV